jgi:hypothetical protein
LASGRCPVGVVFSKLSKLLNQEDALSAPCLQHFRNDCGAIRSRGVVITLASADDFPAVGGRCTGRARRCKARQGRRGKTALRCENVLPQ